MTGREMLIAASLKARGDWEETMRIIHSKEYVQEEEARVLLSKVHSKVVTILDEDYPECFRHCLRSPIVLYYYGDLSLLSDKKRNVAYVGSRDASPYGLEMARYFGGALARRGYVVISGLARGIDAAVAEEVIKERGKTVAILGSGIDCPYPPSSLSLYRRIKLDGLVISEYPNDTPPNPIQFPKRNRLIGGSAILTIIGEASAHSGTLITAGFALSSGADIAAIPFEACKGSVCNALLRDGAFLLDDEDDLDVLLPKLENAYTKNYK